MVAAAGERTTVLAASTKAQYGMHVPTKYAYASTSAPCREENEQKRTRKDVNTRLIANSTS
jgi:hypothetical protein